MAVGMISLVTIVKDAEETLPIMLESAADVVDEIILVDTGSTDHTVRTAMRYPNWGVKIYEWGPTTNFSEPRNFGLGKAIGDWVLHLDADDRLTDIGRYMVASLPKYPLGDLTGYCFLIREECEAPYVAPSSGRLFPRRPNLRYKGHVHMEIKDSDLGEERWSLVVDGPHIVHNGYLTPEIRREKLKRNIRLLHLDIKDDRNDINAMYYLAISYKDLRKEDDADFWARRALSAGTQPPWVKATLTSCLKGNQLKVEWYGIAK
jgi:glycosyltransferase involved in cell wall biosynthesis